MDTLESLGRQITGAGELKSIVRTMKAMAAANIGQYDMAMGSLGDYQTNITLGIIAYLREVRVERWTDEESIKKNPEKSACAIVFGSDLGFVGQFNDSLTEFVSKSLSTYPGKIEIWTIGARIPLLLMDIGQTVTQQFDLPNSINAITALIGNILVQVEENHESGYLNEFYIFHNRLAEAGSYRPESHRLLPLDQQWRQEALKLKWPTQKIPEVIGDGAKMIRRLISQYLFITLYKACAESLASENYSRLGAMQRAEKNIEELLDDIGHTYHRLRQSGIDEELFDVVSGFEALKKG
ncbi:F-type H+-transporting ATPase subunit gamma [Pricia antarctica]|uniref:F-type H+-transporting ATPase subunit gamma n=1 Tax=Pricia antarctica TaxID=641691 RepID=A0A1G7D060_9FLAO|nr:F0F1 ATP synthase subunit gamma [Pricia antarctica]SDE44982.1 F-type H+-transporting ATPase subunit gamma [Pricia antarctica]